MRRAVNASAQPVRATGACAAVLGLMVLSVPAQVFAQAAPWPNSFEIAVGGAWLGGYPLGAAAATLTSNELTQGGRFTLFRTQTDLRPAGAFDAKLGWRLTPVLSIEAGFVVARPRVATAVSDDAEGASATKSEEQLSQYVIDAGLIVHLVALSFAGRRAQPFISGGGGHLRQLHAGGTLLETGQVYHVGGGVKYAFLLRPEHVFKGLGVRADGRAYLRGGGLDLEGGRRWFSAAGLGLFVLF